MVRVRSLVLFVLALCCALAGCKGFPLLGRAGAPQNVPLAELTAHPARYDGQHVCTEGVYAWGFEASSLGPSMRLVTLG